MSELKNKVLYGLVGNKIAVIDKDISAKAKRDCFKEKCTSVIVAEHDPVLVELMFSEGDVSFEMFKGVVL